MWRVTKTPYLRCLILLTALPLLACQGPEPISTQPLRLVDLFDGGQLLGDEQSRGEDVEPTATATEGIQWRWVGGSEEDESQTQPWQAAVGIEGLSTATGLSGRTTTDFPILHGTYDGTLDPQDLVHGVEIRLRVSAGTRLALQLSAEAPESWQRITGQLFPWPFEVPLIADGESHLYTLTPQGMGAVQASQVKHLMLRPSNVAGAEFTVESLRVILRQEHLATIASGVGWHGMESIYRESLVSRQGESLRFSVRLPANPRFDVALASMDEEPPRFRVAIDLGTEVQEVMTERPTTPHRWHPVTVDLADYAGRRVDLLLELGDGSTGGERPRLGFWGTPVVRSLRSREEAEAPPREAAETSPPRGVIVLLADTLRRDHLEVYGYPRQTAPVLTSLATAGTLVEDAIAQATWTKASVPSIFTSLYPSTHGVEHFTDRLPAAAETLAEQFRQAGYATLGLSSITFTGKFTNLHQGYEEFHESRSLPEGIKSKGARYYVDRLLPWLERHREVPFFVFLHVADPHSPYEPYAPYDTLWGAEEDRDAYLAQQNASRSYIANPLMRAFGMPTREELERAGIDTETYVGYEHDAYDGSIRGMDTEIGRLVEQLRVLGLEDEIVLALVSDHGTEFLDHDHHFHGHSVFGELNRVPMFFWGPGHVPAGKRIPARVQTLDLMPTLLELAGLEVPKAAQGQSLVPWMRAAEGEVPEGFRERPAFTEKAQHLEGGASPQDAASMSLAILVDDWKLVHHRERPDDRPEFQLFKPSLDPLDTNDLASQYPQVVTRLAAQLEGWRQEALAQRLSDEGLEEGLSAEEMERLRSLGYVQ